MKVHRSHPPTRRADSALRYVVSEGCVEDASMLAVAFSAYDGGETGRLCSLGWAGDEVRAVPRCGGQAAWYDREGRKLGRAEYDGEVVYSSGR